MELDQIQKEILNWCLEHKFPMLKENIFTRNLKEFYPEGDETWKIYNGILPPKECLKNLDLKMKNKKIIKASRLKIKELG